MKNFVIDVDGVLTTTDLIYSKDGKILKIFGPDDHDALNVLKKFMNIVFITRDKRGFEITKKRVVDEMKFDLFLLHPVDRIKWMQERFNLDETIYMGDGISDFIIFRKVGYAICTNDSFYKLKEEADFVTTHNGGQRAVAEACMHILEKFFGVKELEYKEDYDIGVKK